MRVCTIPEHERAQNRIDVLEAELAQAKHYGQTTKDAAEMLAISNDVTLSCLQAENTKLRERIEILEKAKVGTQ